MIIITTKKTHTLLYLQNFHEQDKISKLNTHKILPCPKLWLTTKSVNLNNDFRKKCIILFKILKVTLNC